MYKLTFELIPEECWRANLRTFLTPEQWDVVRKDAYKSSGHRCSKCGAQGRLEAHEVWRYDDEKRLQTLVGVTALCPACHKVVHISRTFLMGEGQAAEEHFKKVNGCTQSDFHAELRRANEEYARRNQVEGWVTDFSWLKETYGFLPDFLRKPQR
ncbi:MAG: HNH endonuclease [Clostridia bacterium]|nr:HNH endonuclease [Clostridia bacterium]